MQLKPATPDDVWNTRLAIQYLREARNLLKRAGADRTLKRVREAIKSAEGAQRHVERRYQHGHPA